MSPTAREPEDLQPPALLRQLAELDRVEPSPQLDRAVMEKARAMIRPARARATTRRVRHTLRWAGPAALTAAFAALALSIVLRPGGTLPVRRGASALHAAADAPRAAEVARTSGRAGVARSLPVTPLPPGLLPPGALPPLRLEDVSATATLGPINGARRAELESHPGEWLGLIRELRAEGRAEDAAREWRAFSKLHPGYRDTTSGRFLDAPAPLTTTSHAGK